MSDRRDDEPLLFEPPPEFQGLPADGFDVFRIQDREPRRRAIVRTFHPALSRLGDDLLRRLPSPAADSLHAHLPRLDWPRGYQPFCTWLALSREAHGYQQGPQLNVGVHVDHVAIRLGWDTSAAAFGRFEFLCRIGHLDRQLLDLAGEAGLRLRVYAAAPWPEGSRLVLETVDELARTFDEVQRRGVWWELGRRLELPEHLPGVTSPGFGDTVLRDFAALLPVFERIHGEDGPDPS